MAPRQNDWKALRKELLANKETRQEYDVLAPKYELARKVITLRAARKLTQRQLADLAGVKQSAIARLEGGSGATWTTVSKIADATGAELVFRDRQRHRVLA
jgi:DNA-binding XRE family transcriptional regulator